jgi:hypothetical protein
MKMYNNFYLKKILYIIYKMNSIEVLSFSSETPDAKVAPIIVGGAAFVGKAIAGGVIGTAASWATTRYLDNRFPARR